MSITIKKIAKSLKVAPATIDRAIHNRGRISEATKKRILKKLKEFEYRPNILGKSLGLKKSFLIGVVMPDLTTSFYPEIIEGIEDVLDKNGYSIILRSMSHQNGTVGKLIDLLLDRYIDGLIVTFQHFPYSLYIKLKKEKLPVIFLSYKIEGIKGPYVSVDNVLGGYLATEHLIKAGYKRITYVGLWPDITGQERFSGYRKALADYHIPFEKSMVVHSPITDEKLKKVLTEPKPVAIFAATDGIAIALISFAYDLGLNPYQDLAIVGFDDIHFASRIRPALTTIAQPKQEMGRIGAKNLLKLMKGEKVGNVLLKPNLVVRNSVPGRVTE